METNETTVATPNGTQDGVGFFPWRTVAKAGWRIGRRILREVLPRDNSGGDQNATAVLEGVGPIVYNRTTKTYRNQATDETVALFFTSVDSHGRVANNAIDRIVFEPSETKPASALSKLIEDNLAGNVSWSVVPKAGSAGEASRVFVELANWNGSEITLFDLDDDPDNDLMVQLGEQSGRGMELLVRDRTNKFEYELDAILIDASGNTFSVHAKLGAHADFTTAPLGSSFDTRTPIERAYFVARATPAPVPA